MKASSLKLSAASTAVAQLLVSSRWQHKSLCALNA